MHVTYYAKVCVEACYTRKFGVRAVLYYVADAFVCVRSTKTKQTKDSRRMHSAIRVVYVLANVRTFLNNIN